MALAAVLAACGDGDTAPAPPPPPPPGPPSAVATGPEGPVVMASFGGCWRQPGVGAAVCGDPAWPACPDPVLPALPARAGDEVVFSVRGAGDVEAFSVTTGDGSDVVDLPAGRPAVTVPAARGPLVLRAVIPERGDPAWAVCLTPRPGS